MRGNEVSFRFCGLVLVLVPVWPRVRERLHSSMKSGVGPHTVRWWSIGGLCSWQEMLMVPTFKHVPVDEPKTGTTLSRQ